MEAILTELLPIPLTSLLGLMSNALIYCALIFKLTAAERQAVTVRWSLLAMALFFALFPILDEPLVIYFRGLLGDLSLATWLLSLSALLGALTGRNWLTPNSRRYGYLTIAMMALLLYPFALGWGQADTYRLGYDNPLFEWLLVALAGLALWRRCYFVALWLGLALGAYLLKLFESHNLWDYLIDPLVSLVALGHLCVWVARSVIEWSANRQAVQRI